MHGTRKKPQSLAPKQHLGTAVLKLNKNDIMKHATGSTLMENIVKAPEMTTGFSKYYSPSTMGILTDHGLLVVVVVVAESILFQIPVMIAHLHHTLTL